MSKKRTQPSEPMIPCRVNVEPQHMVALRAKDKTVFLVDRNCAIVSQRCAEYLRHVETFIAQVLATRTNKMLNAEVGTNSNNINNTNNPTSTQSNLLSTNTTVDVSQKVTILSDEEYERGMQRRLPFCLFDRALINVTEAHEQQDEHTKQSECITDMKVIYKTIAEVIDERERAARMSCVGGSILITTSALSTIASNLTAASATGSAVMASSGNNNNINDNTITNDTGRSVSAHSAQRNTLANLTKTCYWYSTLEWSESGILYPLIDLADISSASLELGVMYMYEKYRVDAEIDKRITSAGSTILPSSTFLQDHANKRFELLAISRLLSM